MPASLPKLVRNFVCDKNKLVREVNELCKLVERVSEIDYKSKTQSVISVCDNLVLIMNSLNVQMVLQ